MTRSSLLEHSGECSVLQLANDISSSLENEFISSARTMTGSRVVTYIRTTGTNENEIIMKTSQLFSFHTNNNMNEEQ